MMSRIGEKLSMRSHGSPNKCLCFALNMPSVLIRQVCTTAPDKGRSNNVTSRDCGASQSLAFSVCASCVVSRESSLLVRDVSRPRWDPLAFVGADLKGLLPIHLATRASGSLTGSPSSPFFFLALDATQSPTSAATYARMKVTSPTSASSL
jgi:hypothetical protein